MEWQSYGDMWSYDMCPIQDLLGCWEEAPKLTLNTDLASDRTIVGYQAAAIRTDDTGIHYEVRVTNHSDAPWYDVYTWVCFNSFQSPTTGSRPYVRLANRWIPFQDVPHVHQHCYLPANGMTAQWRVTRH